MNILLLGANGQLGTDLQAVVQQTTPSMTVTPLYRRDLDVINIAAIHDVLAPMGFDGLINCTSYHKTDEVEEHATKAFAINTHAVQALAEVCAAKKARFIHVSTDYVFDGCQSRPYVETDACGPLSVYGASKAMGERLAMMACPDTIVARVASLFGTAGASGKGGNFVETMIRVGRDKGALNVIDDMTMSPTATADVATMLVRLLDTNAPAGVYHAVNSESATWYAFAKAIIEQAGVQATVSPIGSAAYPTKAKRPAYSVLDNTKLQQQIGPIAHWHDALTRYLHARGHIA
jgi:dTDP-4-dehydrorhamnose reductase